MLGTWLSTDAVVSVLGHGAHHPKNADVIDFRVRKINLTLVIDKQLSRSFSGKIFSTAHSEAVVGSIAPDGKMAIGADEDGLYEFKIIDDNSFEICYSHSDKKSLAAGCNFFVRQ